MSITHCQGFAALRYGSGSCRAQLLVSGADGSGCTLPCSGSDLLLTLIFSKSFSRFWTYVPVKVGLMTQFIKAPTAVTPTNQLPVSLAGTQQHSAHQTQASVIWSNLMRSSLLMTAALRGMLQKVLDAGRSGDLCALSTAPRAERLSA